MLFSKKIKKMEKNKMKRFSFEMVHILQIGSLSNLSNFILFEIRINVTII